MGSMGSMGSMGGPNALHSHTPRMSVYGAVRIGDEEGVKYIQTGMPLTGTTTLRLEGHSSVTPGVLTTAAFDDYVPKLGDLRTDSRGTPDPDYVLAKIIVPHGVMRPRDLVSWDYEGNQPSTVAFMGTDFRGCVANEAVLEMGDDDDEDTWVDEKHLSIRSDIGLPTKLWPLTKGTNYVDETDPNTLEILITNFTPQRRRGVFWSLHYQSLFSAVGYAPNKSYENTTQYEQFVRNATAFDKDEWDADLEGMGIGYPFPFITKKSDPLPGLEHDHDKTQDLLRMASGARRSKPSVRDPGGSSTPPMGHPTTVTSAGGHDGDLAHDDDTVTVHDPWSRPICPIGQDSI